MHTHSNKHSKSNKQKRHNAMKNAFSKDRIPPKIYNSYNWNQNYEKVKRSHNFQIVEYHNERKPNYPKSFAPIYFSTRQTKPPEDKVCYDILTLLPYKSKISNNIKIERNKSTSVSARLTMNALAASETDINSILELVEKMYNSIQKMLQDVKQQMHKQQSIIEKRRQEPKYIIKVDLKKFLSYLNEQYEHYNRRTEMMLQNGDNHLDIAQQNGNIPEMVPNLQLEPSNIKSNKCRSFNILLQPTRMSFNMTICKFNSCSMDFFQRLATFCNWCISTNNKEKRKPVPSVFIRDWHFRNASQGYLLSLLLRNNNVLTLNVMRKLYFVIITSTTPNLTIEINFKLANGIFMAYDAPTAPFETFPLEIILWNDRHRNILKSSSKILNTPAFTYSIQSQNNLNTTRDTKSDNTLNRSSSYDSNSTLKYESSSMYDENEYFLRSTSYSEYGLFDLKSTESSTDITLKESARTITLSIDEIISYHEMFDKRKDCGDMNFSSMLHEQQNLYNSTLQQSRTWMSQIYRQSAILNSTIVAPYLNSLINETIFDRVSGSIDGYVVALSQYWTKIESQTFCKRVFKDLGNYLLQTFLVSVVY